MNLQQTLDQSAAWHLKQLQMLCPKGTKATIVLRIGGSGECMILGDEPDTLAALWAAVRAVKGVKSGAGQHRKAEKIQPNAMVPIGSAQVLDTQPAPEDMFSSLNGGAVNVGGVAGMEQG